MDMRIRITITTRMLLQVQNSTTSKYQHTVDKKDIRIFPLGLEINVIDLIFMA